MTAIDEIGPHGTQFVHMSQGCRGTDDGGSWQGTVIERRITLSHCHATPAIEPEEKRRVKFGGIRPSQPVFDGRRPEAELAFRRAPYLQ